MNEGQWFRVMTGESTEEQQGRVFSGSNLDVLLQEIADDLLSDNPHSMWLIEKIR